MQTVSWAGATYNIPNQRGDTPWSGISDFCIAVAATGINTGGGNFTLLAPINLGATFGIISTNFQSRTANTATAGSIRLANTDHIDWRNFANNGNLALGINASDQLVFNGAVLFYAGGGLIANADISASAAIAFSKLAALTSGNILVGSVGNVPTSVALSGDATLVASGALTLATVNANVGSFTNANITVNAKGLITAAANGTAVTSVTGTANQITSTGGTTPVLALANPLITPGPVTINGNLTFSPTTAGIVGTTTNDNTTAGNVGEYIESVVSGSPVTFPTSTQWGDITSISLTAGDWDVQGRFLVDNNGTAVMTTIRVGISATAGNSSTGLVVGNNHLVFQNGTGLGSIVSMSINSYRVSISSTTTYYLKHNITYTSTAGATSGIISARRVR